MDYNSVMEFFRGKELSPADLEQLRREIESFDSIEVADDELRGIIKRNWPHLLAKLPPEDA
jgi:hypothetical protein